MAKKKLAKKATRARKTAQTRKRDAKPDNVLRIEYMPLSSLKAAPRNPKLHTPDLARSVDRWGFADAPILDGRTGRLVAGHGRREALLQRHAEGKAPPENVKLSEDGDWLVPVQAGWSSKDDHEAEAFLLAHNKLTEAGGWDQEELAKAVRDLKTAEVDLSGIGFDAKELNALAASLNVAPGGDPGATEPPAKPKSKRGEVYELGPHKLMCGDATSAEDLAALLGLETADVIHADPPYGMRLDTDYASTDRVKGNTYEPVIGDDLDFDPTPILAAFDGVDEQLWWGADYYRAHLPPGGSWFVWDKWCGKLEAPGNEFELCWSKTLHRRRVHRHLWSGFTAKERGEPRTHPTQKPVALIEELLSRVKGDLVIDPFLGSGTTLIAAARQGRRCFGLEISPAYCDVIRKRWTSYAEQNDLDPGPGALR